MAVLTLVTPSNPLWASALPAAVSAPLAGLLGLGCLLVVLVLLTAKWILRRSPRDAATDLMLEKIDITTLIDSGPPEERPSLGFYHIPVRLALLVLAPVGRDGTLPDSSQLPELADQLVPGLMEILQSHQPQFRRWPPQVSSEGFTQAFFSHVSLPGDRGKGTPWCGIAGKFETADGQYLAGMVCRAATRNSLGQVVVDHPGKWLDVLRIRR